MEADACSSFGNAKFARYRSVRKAASREQQSAAVPIPAIPSDTQVKPLQDQGNRAPSRYRRANIQRVNDTPLPSSAIEAPTRYCYKDQQQKPLSKSENGLAKQPHEEKQTSVGDWPKTFQDAKVARKQASKPPISAAPATQSQPKQQPSQMRQIAVRPRSKTASSPQIRKPEARRSYDAAREEARLILEGEYDRLTRLKRQQDVAKEGKRAQAQLRADQDRLVRGAQQQDSDNLENIAQRPKTAQVAISSTRKWTIGGEDGHKFAADAETPLQQAKETSPRPARSTMKPIAKDAIANDVVEISPVVHAPRSKLRKFSISRSRERRPTTSRGSQPQAPELPRAGDGPPKTAVNGPATLDAPTSAVNAGERRVEIRFTNSKISLPVTPSTTVRDLLNSASVIMSQPIDPRTAVLLETYGPLALERPLRRYEHIRDVMNSWDSDTQNHLVILPHSECAATGLEQSDAPSAQPSYTTLQLYHSRRPGKWEKHWMYLRNDGQVTASNKENDGNAMNMFHLSDFDVYMPTRKETKRLRPPKKICFAIKSQQRSIMFESTENFVHFFATNDKAIADQWYNAVQSWRSWYLTSILEQTTTGKAPPKDALAAVAAIPAPSQPRPSTSHSRDSVPYQLGTFKPLLDFDADSFAYGEGQQKALDRPNSAGTEGMRRSLSLSGHSRKPSGLDRSTTVKKGAPPTSFPIHRPKQPSHSKEPEKIVASSTDAAFTGGGLLGRAYSVRKAQAEEASALVEDTNNAFLPTGLLSKQRSVRRIGKEDANPGMIVDTNEAFTGKGLITKKASTRTFNVDETDPGVIRDTNAGFTGGLLSVQRALTKKKSATSTRPGEPLVHLSGNSQFADHSLLRSVEGYEIATGQHMPVIDRSRRIEVKEKVGEAQ